MITYSFGRIVIQQGTSFGAVFPFRNSDLVTCDDFTTWSATFEIFDADGVSLHRWDSATSVNVNTGLWNPTGSFAYNVYVELPPAVTGAMSDWGIGHFDLDVLDAFGHVQYRVHDQIVLEEGSTHA